MKISNVCSQSFGKEAMLSCKITNKAARSKQDATLYKYDSKDFSDSVEIDSMEDLPLYVRKDFVNENFYGGGSLIYILQNDSNEDIISYAQTTRHIRKDGQHNNIRSTQIDEIDAHYGYINSTEPLVAGIAQEAQIRDDDRVVFALRKEDVPQIKAIKLNESEKGELYIPKKRYSSFINKAQERSQIEFYA